MRTEQQILHLATRVCKHFAARLLKKAAGCLCTLLFASRGALDEFACLKRCDNDIEPAAMRTGTLVLSNVPCLALSCLVLSATPKGGASHFSTRAKQGPSLRVLGSTG